MTGELVDLFADRSEGVGRLTDFILAHFPGRHMRFYGSEAGFLAPAEAKAEAAKGGLGQLARHRAHLARRGETGLLVDIGSTTTDILPIAGGAVHCEGFSDETRMILDELVYTGVTRTPVMALATSVPFAGQRQRLMAEYFATAADVHRRLAAARGRRSARYGGWKGQERRGECGPPRAHAGLRRRERRIGGMAAARPISGGMPAAAGAGFHRSRGLARAAAGGGAVIGAGVGRFLLVEIARR